MALYDAPNALEGYREAEAHRDHGEDLGQLLPGALKGQREDKVKMERVSENVIPLHNFGP